MLMLEEQARLEEQRNLILHLQMHHSQQQGRSFETPGGW